MYLVNDDYRFKDDVINNNNNAKATFCFSFKNKRENFKSIL